MFIDRLLSPFSLVFSSLLFVHQLLDWIFQQADEDVAAGGTGNVQSGGGGGGDDDDDDDDVKPMVGDDPGCCVSLHACAFPSVYSDTHLWSFCVCVCSW